MWSSSTFIVFLVNVLHLICLWVNYQVKLTVQIENFGDLFFFYFISGSLRLLLKSTFRFYTGTNVRKLACYIFSIWLLFTSLYVKDFYSFTWVIQFTWGAQVAFVVKFLPLSNCLQEKDVVNCWNPNCRSDKTRQ